MHNGLGRFLLGIALAVFVPDGRAQTAWSLDLSPGTRLTYETTHETTVVVASAGERLTTAALVRQQKQWDVLDRDAAGTSTLKLSIRKLAFEQTEPSGETLRFDSADPSGSHPALAEQLTKLLHSPVRRVKVTPFGAVTSSEKLVDVVVPLTDVPFFVILPNEPLAENARWQNSLPIKLDPPLGEGASVQLQQDCRVEKLSAGEVVVSFTTSAVKPPARIEDRISLLQFEPKGQVTFDRLRRRMLRAKLQIVGKVEGFSGPDSSYTFQSTYTEQLAEPPPQSADRRR